MASKAKQGKARHYKARKFKDRQGKERQRMVVEGRQDRAGKGRAGQTK
jgi:hypothetical protein